MRGHNATDSDFVQSTVEVRYILACGERHISLYAQRAIEANEELFFDYNYTNESHQLAELSLR